MVLIVWDAGLVQVAMEEAQKVNAEVVMLDRPAEVRSSSVKPPR